MLVYLQALKSYILAWFSKFFCPDKKGLDFEVIELEKLNQILNYWKADKTLQEPRLKKE